MQSDRRGHLVELQSIRGVAAMVVVVQHSSNVYDGAPGWWLTVFAIINSRAAVSLFFVLSGYVLTRMLEGQPFTLNAHFEFWLRRAFRIYPALVAVTIVSLCYAIFYRQYHLGLGNWFQHYFAVERQSYLLIALAFAGISAHVVPQVWTVAVELVASILMPGAAWYAARQSKAFSLLLIVSLVIGFSVGRDTPYSVMLFLPFFAVGIWIFFLPSRIRVILRNIPAPQWWFGLAVAGLFGSCALPIPDVLQMLEELGCITFILVMLIHGQLNIMLLRHPRMEWLGNLSYSLYLVHFLAVCGIASVVVPIQQHFGLSYVFISLVTIATTIIIALPLAAACRRWIELPGNTSGKNLAIWLRQYQALRPVRSPKGQHMSDWKTKQTFS